MLKQASFMTMGKWRDDHGFHAMNAALISIGLTILLLWPSSGWAQTVILDNFESGLRVAAPGESTPESRYLWSQYQGEGDTGLASVVPEAAKEGSAGLRINVQAAPRGGLYLQLYPNDGAEWHNAREFIMPGQTWPSFNTINRLKFWFRPAASLPDGGPYRHNIELGTYVRASTDSRTVSGAHYYHFFDILPKGCWYRVIVDWHPQHQVGASGGTEWGEVIHPKEPGQNYFDALTRFYFDTTEEGAGGVGFYDFDSFVFYNDTNPENVSQIAGLAGCYVTSTNEVYVSWQRRKDVANQLFDVRYAFQSIHGIGWSAATPAPGSPVTSGPDAAYAGVRYSTTGISLGTNPSLFIAIRPQGATLFREIVIPLAVDGLPEAPTNLQVK